MAACATEAQDAKTPVNLAIYGLVHDHAFGFIPRLKGRTDVQLVGIVEPDKALVRRYSNQFHLDNSLFFNTFKELIDHTNVQAVAIFTSTLGHRHVVEMCARRGIDVMMEKPMAVNMKEARGIAAATKKGNIQVVVNYETTWYPGNQAAYTLVHDDRAIGDIRKVIICDGHRGPKEIGCSADFLKWLTDPVQNGGGALPDFGCYGAGLMTWLMDGRAPDSVCAVTQHIKPEVYPKVEDEATVVMTYPKAQAILQASWNWPFDRKDMEIYGTTGYILVPHKDILKVRKAGETEMEQQLPPLEAPNVNADPVSYFAAVARKEIQPSGPSSLAVNMIVTEILDAARESVRTGRRIELAPDQNSD